MASGTPERWMRRAIALSRRGFPAPNPHVGCVLVSPEGEIVGEGWHAFAGGLHAEAAALRMAGHRAKGATAYVTLEPCNHVGRQPACSAALLRAGVSKVVLACADPNPKVQGGGGEALRKAGIAVEHGLLEGEARRANEIWMESMRLQRPFVMLKAAMSLDGRIALPSGESKWITGERARREARRLRAEMGAVLVGSGTVFKDDPALTARLASVKNPPVRIVLDPARELGAGCQVFDDRAPTIRVVRPDLVQRGDLGIRCDQGRFDLKELLQDLWQKGITGLLVEGGSQTLSSFLQAGLADGLALFLGNVAFGQGPSWAESELTNSLADATRWRLGTVKRFGDDVLMKFDRASRD